MLSQFIPATLANEPVNEFSSKIALETHIEKRLKSALAEITGTDKIIVAVNADVDVSKQKITSPQKGMLTRKDDANAQVLPGVPAKKEIGKSTTQTAELNLHDTTPAQGSGNVIIRRLAVTILVDNSIPAQMLDVMRDIAMNIVDYNQNRGDRLDIKQMEIKKTNFQWGSLLYPPHMYWLILIVTGSFFLLAASLFLMNPFIKLSGSGQNVKVDLLKETAGLFSKDKEKAAAAPGHSGDGNNSAVSGTAVKTALPFSFIKEQHLSDLSFLLGNEPALDIATIIHYLDTELAVRLLDYFPPDKQAEIAFCLSTIEEVSPEKINLLEEKIKERLGYLIGGEDKVANILNLVSDDVRDRAFDLIKFKDGNMATRLKKQVKDFESFMREIPPQSILVLYRQIDTTMFARVLKSSPADIQKKVKGALSGGAAERLKQEMDLSHPLATARLKKEKHNIMLAVRRMIREGLLEVENI